MRKFNHVYITGDKHGDFRNLQSVCKELNTTRNDLMIILGDTGINYYGPRESKDFFRRQFIASQPITLLCIRGNHEQRPERYGTYKLVDQDIGDKIYMDEHFPNIWFAQDGGIYDINDSHYLTIGGAYSIDKDYRLARGWMWFPNEQLDSAEKTTIYQKIMKNGPTFDHILTHTAPLSQEPTWLFLNGIDQSKVDKSMEEYLEEIAQTVKAKDWWFGHYHGDDNWTDEQRFYHLVYHSIYEINPENNMSFKGYWRT